MRRTPRRPAKVSPESVRERRSAFEAIFEPRGVAVIGATETEGSVGRKVMENLAGFPGSVYAVHPKRKSVLGVKAFPRIGAIGAPVDLAVMATPAHLAPSLVRECEEAGVRGAVILAAGFQESGGEGKALETQIAAARGRMRVLGPNCLGLMVPRSGLNATFATAQARSGNVAFISQSGALCSAILDWSARENVGFSAFVSVGSMVDVGWGDLIDALGNDARTRSILIYMESIGDARSFLSAAREVALTKPIIVLKVGRTEAGAKAAASHTGSVVGSDEIIEAAFRRTGVLRVYTIADLFNMAQVLGKQPRPSGPRLAIVTNAGGPGGLAVDMLVSSGGQVAVLSEASLQALNALLPSHWSQGNPVDLLGDADAARYEAAVEIVARDSQNDGVLVALTPQAESQPLETAERLRAFAHLQGKPILASWMGGPRVAAGETALTQAGIPTFEYPDTAARAFCYMWRYSDNLRMLYETPALASGTENAVARRSAVQKIIRAVQKQKRTLLSEPESKRVLAAYGIPIVEAHAAESEERAVELAEMIGYPVAVKVLSHTISHKAAAGGVKLNVRNGAAVRRAYRMIESTVKETLGAGHFLGVSIQSMIEGGGVELIMGSSIDAEFGPVMLFGAGGRLLEIFKDRGLGLPPLNATLARRMMEQTRIAASLPSVSGLQVEHLLVRFSELVVEQPWIAEIEVNPLLALPERVLALDARVVLHDRNIPEDRLPVPAIRPYPAQYVTPWKLKNGTPVIIRPIRPEDEPLMVEFHKTLSEESVHFRYFGLLKLEQRIAHERLTRICFNDYNREIALVAERRLKDGGQQIIGVGRLSKVHGLDEAEFAIVLSDAWQGQGLGGELLNLLVRIGRREKLGRITAHILRDNIAMRRVCEKAGFALRYDEDEGEWMAELPL